ncbi:SRPBCC family protein [Thermoactinospora rubra]|uniref:SRPBCC family protein n=1 Tax=Thermoactinospora rubra TaxID=1088767 RepID=UPI00117D7D0E|nr:SRPBCC family protein [Thermoactinospora rubra]
MRTTARRSPWGRAAGAAGAGACVGAVGAYFMDPDRGRARRARARDQMAHTTHEVMGGLGVLGRDLANRSKGLAATARYRFAGREADDRILFERVRAQLGLYLGHPHAVEVQVEDGMVRLSGDVLAGEDQRVRRAVRRIPGVRDVDIRWRVHRDASGVPTLQGPGRARRPVPELLQEHWSPTARFLAGTAAASLWGMSRRMPAPLAWTMRCAGSVLAARAATNLPLRRLTGINAGRRAVDVTDAISIAAPPEQIWPLVSDYSMFEQILPDVRQVRRSEDGTRSHWEISGPAGIPVRFDAVETAREEGRRIAWKTVDGQLIAHTGAVRLDPEEGGGTRVQVQLAYNPVAGAAGHAVARLLGADPARKLREDLTRLKEHIEGRQRVRV